ncbi:MAG: response regulator [Candidatus Sumerlaeia bacterium]|nr:response regulator [Candidatus Sumerlaeia bacterium]
MAGEKILLIDSSAAVQELGRSALEEAGFRVVVGSNGAAALTAPELKEFNAIVLDAATEGLDGFLAARELKTNPETYRIPVLLLIPEEQAQARGSQSLRGANGYLLKPFSATDLVARVRTLIEERRIQDQCDQYLREAANSFMEKLAEQRIREAAESKTQLIVERAIQSVITQLDQRMGQEVAERMTSLTAEREQELVRKTVAEVAQSLIEKLAERKVSEAIDSLLGEMTEKVVKKAAENQVPAVARKQLKESMDVMLPREVTAQVQKSIEALVPDVTKKIVMTIDGIAQKVVPKAAREKLPELTNAYIKDSGEKMLPDMVRDLTGRELVRQINDYLNPAIRDAAAKLNRKIMFMWIVLAVTIVVGLTLNVFLILKLTGKL